SLDTASGGAGGAGDEAWRGVDVAGRVALADVATTRDEHVDRDSGLGQRLDRACRRHEGARRPCVPHRGRVAGREVDAVDGVQRVHDLTRRGHALDAREFDPFDVPDDCDLHRAVRAHVVAAAGAAVGSSRSSPLSSSPGDEPGRRYRRSTMMPPMPASIVTVLTQLVSSTWNVCVWKKSGTYME